MDIAVELSLYPLQSDYIPPIQDFLYRLNEHDGIKVVTNSMSTQVSGEYGRVMDILAQEMRRSFESNHKSVFAMKVLGPFAPT